jgi:O-methyltransferase
MNLRTTFRNLIRGKNVRAKWSESLYRKYKDFTMIDSNLFQQNLELIQQYCKMDSNHGKVVVECGVWRGGMIAAMAEVLGNTWEYHLFDSFEGLPKAKEIDGKAALDWQANTSSEAYYSNCMAEMSFAEKAMSMAGSRPIFHRGWFNETIPNFRPGQPITILRLDGDWYESTMTCLKHLYPYLENDGLLIIDDYFAWDGCSKAVHDYLSSIKSNSRIRTNGYLCYIIKNENGRESIV